MKQRIKAVGSKTKQFNSRINQYQHIRQSRTIQQLNNEGKNHQYEIPSSVKSQTFLRGVWNERKEQVEGR